MAFVKKVKEVVKPVEKKQESKGFGLVSGFNIIKQEQEEYAKRKKAFENGGGNIWESFVTQDRPSFDARFAWDGDPDTLVHTLAHSVPEVKLIKGKRFIFTRKRQCNLEIGLDHCSACSGVNKDIAKKSRIVIFPLINREKREYKDKVYSDQLSYILVYASQLDMWLEKAEELKSMGIKFNEVDFKVKKLNMGTKNASWYLTPLMKTKRKLTKEENDKFNAFHADNTQFAPMSNKEWEDITYVVEKDNTDEEGGEKEYQW